ncbi:hypothetical protein [Bacterioplanoides sp.]|uniref:Cap15 family cyclic dinucleotide receptor domain-containing protein n=1 Tax=Bacterioplanoides sp. TaxID=2066072 RepID=UPI003AFF8DF0
MINLFSITKLFVAFALIYFVIITGLIYLLPKVGVSGVSETRVAFSVGSFFELLLVYIFASGWRKIWAVFPSLNTQLFPDLNGEWNAKIYWNWNGNSGCKEGVVYIKQYFIKISVDLVTDESESKTLMVKPFKNSESDQASFYYMYHSESKATSYENKKDHKGAAILHLSHDSRNIMSGNYFTDRETFGHYVFERKAGSLQPITP